MEGYFYNINFYDYVQIISIDYYKGYITYYIYKYDNTYKTIKRTQKIKFNLHPYIRVYNKRCYLDKFTKTPSQFIQK